MRTTQYLYGNLNQPFQVTASRAPDNVLTVYFYDDYNALYAFERGGARYYVASDHLGTPKVITDNTGTIVRQVEYDSWGVKISDTNPSFDLPVGFAGGIPDDATGLVRFGFRDYEPGTGSWAAKDPIFFRGGLNLFQYVGNDPVNGKDPSGMMNPLWHFGITYWAARDSNMGVWASLKLAAKVVWQDTKGSMSPLGSDQNRHGMGGYNKDGTRQDPLAAAAAINNFINNPGDYGIEGAIHAAQDYDTPVHAGEFFDGMSFGHILGDLWPGVDAISNAYWSTRSLLGGTCR